MANSLLKITVANPNKTTTTTTRDLFATSRHAEVNRLVDYLRAVGAGAAQGSGNTLTVAELGTQTQASGTVTCTGSVSNNSTVTVGNVTFTAKTSGATGNQFNIGTATVSAQNLVAAINANTSLNPYVLASNVAGVVTITGVNIGALGNLLELGSSDGTNLAVVAMASGVDASVTSYSF